MQQQQCDGFFSSDYSKIPKTESETDWEKNMEWWVAETFFSSSPKLDWSSFLLCHASFKQK